MVEVQRLSGALARIVVPTPFPVGPVNAYLVDAGEPALIDVGPSTDEAWAAIVDGLGQLGRAPEDVRRLVVTHGHLDHFGLAHRLPNARVHVHVDDIHATARFRGWIETRLGEYESVGRLWGIPAEYHGAFRALFEMYAPMAPDLPLDRIAPLLGNRETLRLGDLALDILHCPGHTEGLVCFHARDEKLLFAGDHLLQDITPNPNVYVPLYRGRRTGLAHYLESLSTIESLDVATILPGHGAPYTGVRDRVAEIRRHHEERKSQVLGIVRERDRSVVGVVRTIWRELPPDGFYLALREVHGHLELLEEEGRVAREMRDGVARFRAIA